MAEANAAVRKAHLTSDRVLADRLYRLARTALPSLRNVGYHDVFGAFIQELPRFTWKTVRVNPDDVVLAREAFPGADIDGEPSITGGLEAATEGGQFRVVNTFEKRLDRVWEEMLPDIMRELAEQKR